MRLRISLSVRTQTHEPLCLNGGIALVFELLFIVVRRMIVLYYSIVFLIIALIAGLFGFGFIASAAAGIAKILFTVFLILFLLSLVMGRRAQI
jgi:uncharacterized membrane protein YtjA (UPF0391 family)